MPRVVLASALSRWLPAHAAGASREAAFEIDATDLHGLLDALFARHPNLRGYVLDEQGVVRHHVAIFVDGQLVVTRTRDGGQTFEQLRTGLPQHHCYDLIYRHAIAIDATGERLAIGSTTGGLWISEDQGDTWAALDARLPPVHAVVFG